LDLKCGNKGWLLYGHEYMQEAKQTNIIEIDKTLERNMNKKSKGAQDKK
jgi:hypothetical protein